MKKRDLISQYGLPADVKTAFAQINTEIQDLHAAALEKDGGKRFGEKVGQLTGNAMFQATLAKGTWLVYVRNQEGTPAFQKRLEISDSQKREMQLTSR